MTTREEQQRIDDEARRRMAETLAQSRALSEVEGRDMPPAAAPRRVELPPDPELDRITPRAFEDEDMPPSEPVEPEALPPGTDTDFLDALAADRAAPEAPNTDLTSGVAGVDGIHDYDFEAQPREGDPYASAQTVSEHANGLGLPWGPEVDTSAETFGTATDSDPTFPGSMLGDEPEAVDNPTEEADEADAATTPEMLGLDQLEEKRGRERDEVAALPPEARLDAGLPSEGQIHTDEALDPLRRIAHALGSGLMVAGGRTPPQYENVAEAHRQERARGLRERMGAKGEMRADEATAASEAERAAVSDALRERQVSAAERTAESTAAQRDAQMAHLQLTDQQTAEQRAAMERVDSSESQSARRAWQAGVERLPAGMRDRLASVIPPSELAGMNATQLEGPLRMLERISVGARGSGAGGGGGESRRPALEAAARAAGITPEIIAASTPAELADLVHRAGARAPEGPAEGEMFTVAAPAGAPPFQLSSAVYSDPVSQRQVRDVLEGSRQIAQQIGIIDGLRRQYGASLAIPGSAGYRAAALAQSRLATAQSRISNAGTINAGEREIYLGDAPPAFDLADVLTGDTDNYDAMVDTWRQTLQGSVDAIAEGGGVPPAEMGRWRSYYTRGLPGRGGQPPERTPAAAPSAPAGRPGMRRVRIRQPDGSLRAAWVPEESAP